VRRLFRAPRRNAATALLLAAVAGSAIGDRAYAAPPASNEIRIGNTAPYTGPASAYGVIAKVIAAYLDKVNAEGGINGRKVNMITYDDAYEPIKTMEMTRKLVEDDQVLLTLGTIGTNTNATIQPYLNSKKVPCRALRPGTSRASFPGPLASCRPMRLKRKFLRSICWRTIPAAGSPSSIRRMGWARNT
jgi:hypothetical protein